MIPVTSLLQTDSQGVFCSHLVSTVFSFHLWKVSMGPVRYLPQVGGLALTAAAVRDLA